MVSEEVMKSLDDLSNQIAKELKKINAKGDMNPVELKNASDAVCLLEKIQKIQNGGDFDEFSNSMSHGGSYRRMRSPTTGRYMSYDDGYSGHSIHDRMIAALENLMDGAESNYEREVISNGIRMIRQYER